MISGFARWISGALAALALAGCERDGAPDRGAPAPDPLFYEIVSETGVVEGWMLGTIHALPDGIDWHTPAIRRTIDEADYLIVEVAALRDRDRTAEIFTLLATSPDQPDLTRRVAPQKRAALERVLREAGRGPDSFGSTETWAAALILARLATSGDPANGVDAALIADFDRREVRELEGAMAQLRLFDSLPEADQRDLLEGVIDEIEALQTDPDHLRTAWLAGDEKALAQATASGIMADRELREALLLGRNRTWLARIDEALKADQRPLIAVGAGHLVGPDGLAAMLETRGYSVRRVRR